MSRIGFLALSLLATGLAASAPAQTSSGIRFEVDSRRDDHVQLRFDRDWEDDFHGNWSQSIALADLKGMAPSILEKDGPVGFSYVRPAGRFDCNGRAEKGRASGTCTFTVNDAFARLLADRGIERPSRSDYFGLAMSGVDSDVIDAVIKAGMGTPSPEQLIGLGIFKVTPDFVRAMANVEGMKVGIRDLVQFKIFKITPESVRDYAALGYRGLKPNDLVTFSIHRITPDYIRELAALGYRDLPPNMLVQMRIFGVTASYIRSLQARGEERLSPEALVKRRITGIIPQNSWARAWRWNGRRADDRARRN